MKKLTKTLALLVAAVPLFAQSPDTNHTVIITTGSPTGNYYKFGKNIAKILDVRSKVITSKGSLQNIERLTNHEAQIGIAQADALRYASRHNAETKKRVEAIMPLQKECLYVIAKKGGKVADDDDLQDNDVVVAVGSPGSGSFVTWQYMGELEEGFTKPKTLEIGGGRAVGKVLSGEADAALFVYTPGNNWAVKLVKKNPDLKLVPVTDRDLDDKYRGRPIYTREKIVVDKGILFDKTIPTICTEAMVIANDELSDDSFDRLTNELLMRKDAVTDIR